MQRGCRGEAERNPVRLMARVGDADRQWLAPQYLDTSLEPLGRLRAIIPKAPGDPDSVLDAFIAFAPNSFASCPSLAAVRAQISDRSCLDFHPDVGEVPEAWGLLREEARAIFEKLTVSSATLAAVRAQPPLGRVAQLVRPAP
jgi:hypothetical protein